MAQTAKRDQFGYWTRSLAKEVKSEALCDSCARKNSCKYNLLRTQGIARDAQVVIKVAACDHYVPRIVFNDPTIPKKEFNTLRLGDKSKNYLGGDYIEIVDGEKRHLAYAVIRSVQVALRDEACLLHAHRNHTVKDLDLTRAEKVAKVNRAMQRSYHSYQLQRAEHITAIYVMVVPTLPTLRELK